MVDNGHVPHTANFPHPDLNEAEAADAYACTSSRFEGYQRRC